MIGKSWTQYIPQSYTWRSFTSILSRFIAFSISTNASMNMYKNKIGNRLWIWEWSRAHAHITVCYTMLHDLYCCTFNNHHGDSIIWTNNMSGGRIQIITTSICRTKAIYKHHRIQGAVINQLGRPCWSKEKPTSGPWHKLTCFGFTNIDFTNMVIGVIMEMVTIPIKWQLITLLIILYALRLKLYNDGMCV